MGTVLMLQHYNSHITAFFYLQALWPQGPLPGEPQQMGFLESVYSFVFGDGDPNTGREKKQLAAVAAAARRNGGVLTAEQMAPLLDPPEYEARQKESRF